MVFSYKDFENRLVKSKQKAPYVYKVLEEAGCSNISDDGIEQKIIKIRERMGRPDYRDKTLLSTHFVPDVSFEFLGGGFKGDLKWTKFEPIEKYFGHTIELDAFMGYVLHSKIIEPYRIILFLTTDKYHYFCFLDDIIENGFVKIFIPKRWNGKGHNMVNQSYLQHFGKLPFECNPFLKGIDMDVKVNGGSGTIYGAIPKLVSKKYLAYPRKLYELNATTMQRTLREVIEFGKPQDSKKTIEDWF